MQEDSLALYLQAFECGSFEDLAQKITLQRKELDRASNEIFDILLLYVKRCLTRNPPLLLNHETSSTAEENSCGKGLKLPASVIGGLSVHFSSQDLCRQLSSETQDRFKILPQLKQWLAKYVTRLHVSGKELWPPRAETGPMQLPNTEDHTRNHVIGSSPGHINDEEISEMDLLFLQNYHYMQCSPLVDFALFPRLSVIILDGVPLEWISNLCSLREHLTILNVTNTCIYDLNKLFSVRHSDQESNHDAELMASTLEPFSLVEHLTLSNCVLSELSRMQGINAVARPPLSFFPHLISLDMSNNEMRKMNTALAGLNDMMNLSSLDLSHNFITSMKSCNIMVGNITSLNLSHNYLTTVEGLDKLYSLESLLINNNQIRSLSRIVSIAQLPQLMRLDVRGNPVVEEDTALARIHILHSFLEVRANFLCHNASLREAINILPRVDGCEISHEELVAIRDLSVKGSSADALKYPDRSRSYNISSSSESQFVSTPISLHSDGGRVKRNIPRRNVEIHDFYHHKRIPDETLFNQSASPVPIDKFITIEEVIALNCNLLMTGHNDEANNIRESKSISDEGDMFHFCSSLSSTERLSEPEFRPNVTGHEIPCATLNDIESEFRPDDTGHVIAPETLHVMNLIKSTGNGESSKYLDEISTEQVVLNTEYIHGTKSSWPETKSPQPSDLQYETSLNIDDMITDQNQHDASLQIQHLSYQKFSQDEMDSVYDGPLSYSDLLVSKYLELYFKCFIFPSSVSHMEGDVTIESAVLPRIQLYQPDRELMLWIHSERNQSKLFSNLDAPNYSDEKLIYFSREDVIPCGLSATSRIIPCEKINRNFHGDVVADGEFANYADSRKLLLCVSNVACFILPADNDTMMVSSRFRPFPSCFPSTALFKNGLWAHAHVYHPLKCLKRITIGFRFQRITLHFSLPLLRDAFYINSNLSMEYNFGDYTYVLLTHNKKRAVNLVQMLLNANKRPNDSIEVTVENTIQVYNDDVDVLDRLARLCPGATWDVGIRHYQLVHQRWEHGERSPVRRLIVLTNDRIFLLHEYYVGDGCFDRRHDSSSNELNIGDPIYSLVDSAMVVDIIEVSTAVDDSRLLTIIIKAESRLKRTRRLRMICHDSDGAEKLVDDVRKAMVQEKVK